VPWEKCATLSLGMTVPQTMQLRYGINKEVTETNTAEILATVKTTLDCGTPGKVVIERTDGSTFIASLVPNINGGLVISFEDITEYRRKEEKISHMAHYDALTDLPNRTLFYEKMDELLACVPQNGDFAVFSLDLDHFKSVNDTLGQRTCRVLTIMLAEKY